MVMSRGLGDVYKRQSCCRKTDQDVQRLVAPKEINPHGHDPPKLEVEDNVAARLEGTPSKPGSLCCRSSTDIRSLAPPTASSRCASVTVRIPRVPQDAVLPAVCSQRARLKRRMLSLMWMSCLRSCRSCSLIANCSESEGRESGEEGYR